MNSNKIGLAACVMLLVQLCRPSITLATQNIKLYGNFSQGYYSLEMYIGWPPQQQSLLLDTGSDDLLVETNECSNCKSDRMIRNYYPAKSTVQTALKCQGEQLCETSYCSTKKATQCLFRSQFKDGTTQSGKMVKDMVGLEADLNQAIKTVIGLVNLVKTKANMEANGILGLRTANRNNYFNHLYQKHKGNQTQKLYSICLAQNGGSMRFFKRQNAYHDPDVPVVNMTFEGAGKTISDISSIKVNGQTLYKPDPKNAKKFIIDSGSTFVLFPKAIYDRFEEILTDTCTDSEQCLKGTGQISTCFLIKMKAGETSKQAVNRIYPNITFQIGNQTLNWSPHQYFLRRSPTYSNEVCLSIKGSQSDMFSLGHPWMVGKDVVFNFGENKAEVYDQSSCDNKNPKAKAFGLSLYRKQVVGPLSYVVPRNITKMIIALVLVFLSIILIAFSIKGCKCKKCWKGGSKLGGAPETGIGGDGTKKKFHQLQEESDLPS